MGQIANLVMTMAYVLPPLVMYKFLKGKAWVAVGMSVGTVTQIVAALLCNRFITFPLYMGAAAAASFAGLWGYIVLFNLIKAAVISVITFFVYKRLSTLIDKIFAQHNQSKEE